MTRRARGSVLTHQSPETHHKPMPSSQQSGSSISLCSSQSQRQSRATAGSRRADPPRTHPSFMGCNPRPEWVTGARGAARVGGQWSLMCVYMCGFPFPLECTGVELSASLCQTLKAFQWPGERLEGSVGSGHLFTFVSQLHLVRTCCI